MRKTGNRWRILALIPILFSITSARLAAQGVNVSASLSETAVFTGERIVLTVQVSGKDFRNVSNPQLPDLKGLQYLSTTPSTSSNYSYVNGHTSRSYSYIYYLQAEKQGSYTVPPITVTIDGKNYKTEPISVKIQNRNAAAQSRGNGNKPDIFLKMQVSDRHPFMGEQVTANVVLYFKSSLDVISYQPNPGWKAEGFWKEELDENQQPQATSVILGGERYRKATLIKYALFPTKSDKLTLSPFEVTCSVRYNTDNSDPFSSFFGGSFGSQRSVDLQTDPLTLTIKPLPNPPAGSKSIGAVGDFTITRSLSPKQIKNGESLNLTTVVKGEGNLSLISQPDYKIPNAFEIYQPQEKSNINRNGNIVQGTKTFTNLMVARKPGSYTIPAVKLAYFNTLENRYRFATLPAINVMVTPGSASMVTGATSGGLSIKPVTGLATWTNGHYQPITRLWWFWIGLFLPLVLLGIGYWQKTYRDRMLTDTQFARSHTALDRAVSLIDKASTFAQKNDIKTSYALLHEGLCGYIGDKLNLPPAGLSDEDYIQKLQNRNLNDDILKRLKRILNKCSTIRFAPLTSTEDFFKDAEATKDLLNTLKRNL